MSTLYEHVSDMILGKIQEVANNEKMEKLYPLQKEEVPLTRRERRKLERKKKRNGNTK